MPPSPRTQCTATNFLDGFRSCPTLTECLGMLQQAKRRNEMFSMFDVFKTQNMLDPQDWIRFHTVFLMDFENVPKDWFEFDEGIDVSILSGGNDPSVFSSIPSEDFRDASSLERFRLPKLQLSQSTSSCDVDRSVGSLSTSSLDCTEKSLLDLSAYEGIILTEPHGREERQNGPDSFSLTAPPPYNHTGGFSFLGDVASVCLGCPLSDLGSTCDVGSDMQSSIGGIHHPADGYGVERIPLLLPLKGPDCGELEHWILGSVFGMAPNGTDILPFDVQSMPIYDLVEGPNEDTGDMCHGWFSSYILGYAATDVYTFTHKDPVPDYPKFREFCVVSYPGLTIQNQEIRNDQKTPTRWGGRVFVLKQNMVLEFVSRKEVFETRPSGFLSLCGARIEPLAGNPLALSVTAMRIPMTLGKSPDSNRERNSANFIQVVFGAPSASRMKIWLKTLQRAAKLRETDIYTFIDLPSNEMKTTDDGNTVSLSLLDSSRGKMLAKSPYCTIHAARRPNGRHCAIKKIMTAHFFKAVANNTERFDGLLREIFLQGVLSAKSNSNEFHPTVPVFGVFETTKAVFIEMELMSNVDLFDRISRGGIPSLAHTACLMKKLIESTKFCVDNGIAHRDIKLSNIVFPLNDDRASSARLTDFGMAYQISSSGTLKGRCGTPGYVAPEILRADAHEPYGVNVDMFSIGVVSYVLFSGYEPFGGLCPAARISMNKKCMWEFHPLEEWAKVPESGKDMIIKMLEPDRKKRITLDEALCHPFIMEYAVLDGVK